ncbi:MAG: hypothetical protein LUG12_06250 [Erysipelotrichaceae bacterium]|nr:hypothetical protein [Erysipelotrichaceae bacterium]
MKKIIILLLIPLIIVGIHIFMLINYGYIRDIYYSVIISDDLVAGLWTGIFISIFTTILIYCLVALNRVKTAIIVLMILMMFSGNIIYNYIIFSKDYPLDITEERLND